MEISTNQKYAIAAVALSLVGYFGYTAYQNKVAADKVAADLKAADDTKAAAAAAVKTDADFIKSFLDGKWTWAYKAKDNSFEGADPMIIKGNDVFWTSKSTTVPEFTITSVDYNSKTGKVIFKYKRNGSTENWVDDLTINKTAKTLTGTQNDGTINLVYTKTA